MHSELGKLLRRVCAMDCLIYCAVHCALYVQLVARPTPTALPGEGSKATSRQPLKTHPCPPQALTTRLASCSELHEPSSFGRVWESAARDPDATKRERLARMENGYSVTLRHERITNGGAAGAIRHSIRSVEERNGVYRNHSNEKIDPQRTGANLVLVNDGDGGFKEATTTQQVHGYRRRMLNKRTDKRKLRKNQVSHMETLVQLDGAFTGTAVEYLADSHGTTEESKRLLQVLTDHVVEMVGQERINYIALHVDETSPHVHIGWTPIADDGSLEYRKVIGDTYIDKTGKPRGLLTKKMLSEQHKAVRKLMNDNGYPAVEVYASRKHEKHEVFKRQKKELDVKFAEREFKVEQRESDCELRERRVSRREDALTKNKEALKTEREAFEKQQKAQKKALEAQQQQLNEVARRQKTAIEKREKALKEKTEAEQQKISNERDAMLKDVQKRENSVGEREQAQQQFKSDLLKFMNSKPFRDKAQEIGNRGTEGFWRIAEETISLAERIGVEWKPGSFSGTSNSRPQARERTRERVEDTWPPARTPERSTKAKKKKSGDVAEILRKMDEQKQQEGPDV